MSPMRLEAGLRATRGFQARLAASLESREVDFAAFIQSIESDPLFLKLAAGPDPSARIIRRIPRSFSRNIGSSVEVFEEFIPAAEASGEVEKLLEDREELLSLIRGIGEQKFRTFFLKRIGPLSTEDAAVECGLTFAEARALEDLVQSLDVLESFHAPPAAGALSVASALPDETVARVVRLSEGAYQIVFRSTGKAGGFYEVDHEKLRQFKNEERLSEKESARLSVLLRDLEIANLRKSMLFRVIEQIVENRKSFFESAGRVVSGPWRQKDLAKTLAVHPSVVSRAVNGRSLEMPWGARLALKSFFDGGASRVRDVLESLLEKERACLLSGDLRLPFSDREISRELSCRMGRRFASNTIAKYRLLWEIPNSYRRTL